MTTFATTPVVKSLYPPWYQKKLASWKRGEIDWDGNCLLPDGDKDQGGGQGKAFKINKMTMLLRLDSLPSLLTFINLLGGECEGSTPKAHKAKFDPAEEKSDSSRSLTSNTPARRPVEVDGLRIMQLTQRTSTVMTVSEVDEFTDRDPVLNVFRTFGRLNHLAISTGISVAPEDSFAEVLTTRAADRGSELLLVPWSETGAVTDPQDPQSISTENRFTSTVHNQFISKVLALSSCSTAILVDRGFGGVDKALTRTTSLHSLRSPHKTANLEPPTAPVADPSHHIFFPYFGGDDDKLALRFVLQLCENPNVTATVVHIVFRKDARINVPEISIPPSVATAPGARRDLPRGLSMSNVPTVAKGTESDSNPELVSAEDTFFKSITDPLSSSIADRVHCERVETNQALRHTLVRAGEELGTSRKNAGDLLVLGRSAVVHRPYIREELVGILETLGQPSGAGTAVRNCLGDVAEAAIMANIKASVLVIQAGVSNHKD